MLVSPARNHSNSWTIAFSGNRLVVSSGKPALKIEAHLMAEDRQRAGAGAVVLLRAVGEDPFEQVVILIHGVGLGLSRKANLAAGRRQSTATSTAAASVAKFEPAFAPLLAGVAQLPAPRLGRVSPRWSTWTCESSMTWISPTRGSFSSTVRPGRRECESPWDSERHRAIERTRLARVTAERCDPDERRAALGGRGSLMEHESKREQSRRCRNASTHGTSLWRDCIA